MSDSRSYRNNFGIEISSIQLGDKYTHYDSVGFAESIDWIYERVWGYFDEYGKLLLYLRFEDIHTHEPQFKPYDPTQVGDKDDDI